MNKLKWKLGYAAGDIYGGGAFLLVSLLFLNFLTDVELLNGLQAAVILFTGKVWDAVTDPLMGLISDMTRSRFGRRRVYFLFGSLLVTVSFVMMFYSFGIQDTTAKFIYYIFAHIFFSTAFTIVMIPYNAILPEMVTDYNERTSYTTYRMLFSQIAAILAGLLPGFIINMEQISPASKNSYLLMALIFALVFGISWIVTFFGTKERKQAVSTRIQLKDYKTVLRNRSFRIYLVLFMIGQGLMDVLTGLFLYYLILLNRAADYTLVLGVMLVTQIFTLPFYAKIAATKGKVAPLYVALPIWAITLLFALTLSPTSPLWQVVCVGLFSGLTCASITLVPFSILPDIPDVDELISGKRREGLYSGIATFARKLVGGIILAIIGIGLYIFGYDATLAPQEIAPLTFWGIKGMFTFLPILMMFITIIAAKKYPLHLKAYETLMKEVGYRRKHGGKSVANAHTKLVCEEITGISFKEYETWKK